MALPEPLNPDAEVGFVSRHIGPDDSEVATMLARLGYQSLEALIDAAVPEAIRDRNELDLPAAASEAAVTAALRMLTSTNVVARSLLGLGYHATVTPPVIRRNIVENPAWYTAYTPYQPEISQGRLEMLLNFQTMVADLTGTEIANASLLDEATAVAEAMTLARRVGTSAGEVCFVDEACHPQTLAVVATRAEPLGITIETGNPFTVDTTHCFAVIVQNPGTTGEMRDLTSLAGRVHDGGAILVVATDLLACVLMTPPGEQGADVVVGSTQRFGVPMAGGGPHAAFIATRQEFSRSLPGRLVGVSVDAAGRPALRLALQTREQHIRREKATSNICTAQVLLAVVAAAYACWHGPDGLRRIAGRVHALTNRLASGAVSSGATLMHDTWFDTLTIDVGGRASAVVGAALTRNINLRALDADRVVIALDETCDKQLVDAVVGAIADGLGAPVPSPTPRSLRGMPDALVRRSQYMNHPVFHNHRSETEMLRYLRRLADLDLALDRAMIPLGSCTMKLNGTTEMEPITWPELAELHPFAPAEQTAGLRTIISDLERWLAEITGYAAVSLQPNAGSQGELAGLLAIRAYHADRGDAHRDVCLIPASAHGTNAASAVMAGMRVVVVACDNDGNIDLDDLKDQTEAHAERVAAMMVTYPSTHGVYETRIGEACEMVHAVGGQVYLDGANLNALVGLAKPGAFGSDVSHLNLHKTFCIPHGGGGPGVGPVAVREHLAPYLPNHPLDSAAGPASGPGPVAAAPFGSAGILPISWAYIALMGPAGLRRATEVAVLSANYIASRLRGSYDVLYSGRNGLVAHECIIDLRPLKATSGVTVDDVAKRLIDYGFHAPTMSFPVAGTLMIEPTESESLAEIDRFCDALVAIRAEIAAIESGQIALQDAALSHAPHTAADVVDDSWIRAYSRQEGAFPGTVDPAKKYWPPVARIDGAHGDRNLMCSCPSPEAYAN